MGVEGNKLAGIVRYVSAKEQGRVSSLVFRKRCNCDQQTCMRYKLWYAILFWVGRGGTEGTEAIPCQGHLNGPVICCSSTLAFHRTCMILFDIFNYTLCMTPEA